MSHSQCVYARKAQVYVPHTSLFSRSKANNTAGWLAVRFLTAFSQSNHIVVGSLQLTHGPLVSLTDFLGSCTQVGCKLTPLLPSLLQLNI